MVQQITAPRRQGVRTAQACQRSLTRVKDSDADWAHQYGPALVDILEHLPTDHLHSKVAATVVVTMNLDQLRGSLKVAGTDRGEPGFGGEGPPVGLQRRPGPGGVLRGLGSAEFEAD